MNDLPRFADLGLLVFAGLFLGGGSVGADEPKAPRPAKPAKQVLFDGKTLKGWKIVKKYDFEKHGQVVVNKGEVILETGKPATGIAYNGKQKLPLVDYELSLEAKRIEGDDFFCGLTFPIQKSHCTLIIGGWGGGVTGLSNIDDMSAVDNETTGYSEFKNNRWYKIRLRVTAKKVQAWVGKEQIVDVNAEGREFSVWWEQEPARPLGFVTWNTKAALRKIELKKIAAQD